MVRALVLRRHLLIRMELKTMRVAVLMAAACL